MKKKCLNKRLKNQFNIIKNKIWVIPTTLIMMSTKVFAGSISTAEVTQATENVKKAVIKLAMPIRRNFSICKHRNNCFKNDSKFK